MRIALLREAARWHLSAHLLDEDERRFTHLEAAHQLLVQADALAEQLGADAATRGALLGDAALGRFYLLRDQGNRRFDPQVPAGYRYGQGESVAAAVQNLTTNFAAGRSLHELRLARLEADAQVPAEERYRAQLELADWYLLFDRNDEAIARYRKARAANPTPADTDPFAAPLPLPAARGSATSALAVRIRLDVSAEKIRAAAKESVAFQRQKWDEQEAKSLAAVKAGGAEIVEVDKASFQAVMGPVYDKFMTTPDMKRLVKAVQDTM